MISYLFIFCFSFIGGLLYRWRGDQQRRAAKILYLGLIALPVLFMGINEPWYVNLIIIGLFVSALALGHGNNHDLGQAPDQEFERYERVSNIYKFKNKMPVALYDVFALSFGGVLVTLPLAYYSFPLAFAGAAKGLCYVIGHIQQLPKFKIGKIGVTDQNGWGEFLFGFWIWLCLWSNIF